MPKIKTPLFRDPIYDAPTDPTVIYNEKEQLWYMFYTQRRAVEPIIGVAWVHGTKIGVAVSKDLCSWMYRGALEGLDIEPGHNTFWASYLPRRCLPYVCFLYSGHSGKLAVSARHAALHFRGSLALDL